MDTDFPDLPSGHGLRAELPSAEQTRRRPVIEHRAQPRSDVRSSETFGLALVFDYVSLRDVDTPLMLSLVWAFVLALSAPGFILTIGRIHDAKSVAIGVSHHHVIGVGRVLPGQLVNVMATPISLLTNLTKRGNVTR
jgi:hypothetical protein